jgi:hypothetical protein
METMPSRDTSGNCIGECRDRVMEGEVERQEAINRSDKKYDEPARRSPTWTSRRNEPPGAMGGHV